MHQKEFNDRVKRRVQIMCERHDDLSDVIRRIEHQVDSLSLLQRQLQLAIKKNDGDKALRLFASLAEQSREFEDVLCRDETVHHALGDLERLPEDIIHDVKYGGVRK